MLQEGSRLKKQQQNNNNMVEFYTWLLLARIHDKLKHTEKYYFKGKLDRGLYF